MLDFGNITKIAYNALGELLYPTRCILCDAPGALICKDCLQTMPLIKRQTACPRCGAPFGKLTCTECHPPGSRDKFGEELPLDFPFVQARAACTYEGLAKRLITVYKDSGEQRLSTYIASLICSCIRTWNLKFDAIVSIPPNKQHLRNRGFDHMELVAQQCSRWLELPLLHALTSSKSLDQRDLNMVQRVKNKEGSMRLSEDLHTPLPANIVLIDDVFTTGATLVAATNALLNGGACRVFVAVCARVW